MPNAIHEAVQLAICASASQPYYLYMFVLHLRNKKTLNISDILYHPLRVLSLGDDGDTKATVGTLQHQLLVPPRLEVVTDRPNKNEPSNNHENISNPVRARNVCDATATSAVPRVHAVRIEIVRVWIGRARVAVRGIAAHPLAAHAACSRAAGALHVKPILDQSDAQTGTRAVLRCVRRVEEIGEQETDELEGHGNHAVPDEAEYGADWHAIDIDLVRATKARGENGRLPVWGCGICCRLLICLKEISTASGIEKENQEWTYGRLLFLLVRSPFRLCGQVREHAIGLDAAAKYPV